jgi:putative ATP-dependent endonuclease of OLD family
MHLARLRLENFRCFGPETTTIEMDQVTALLGSNGSGKTAVLQAVARLFGTTQAVRTLLADDFHVPHGQRRDSVSPRSLLIEAELEFDSLGSGTGNDASATVSHGPPPSADPAVPPFFEQMAISREDGKLFCRMRLTGTWTKTLLADGTVESELEWLRSADDAPTDDLRSRVSPTDRDRIRVHYVPAFRDASRQLSAGPGGLLQQLLSAIDWDEEIRSTVKETGRLRHIGRRSTTSGYTANRH